MLGRWYSRSSYLWCFRMAVDDSEPKDTGSCSDAPLLLPQTTSLLPLATRCPFSGQMASIDAFYYRTSVFNRTYNGVSVPRHRW